MQSSIPKGPPTPRTAELRSSLLTKRLARPNSAKFPRNEPTPHVETGTSRNRCSSARTNQDPLPPAEEEEKTEEPEEQQHKEGCPWLKLKTSRSKNILEKNLHPKPWGARDISKIPCFCNASKSSRDNSPFNLRPKSSRLMDKLNKLKSPQKKGNVIEIVNNLGTFLERRKIKLSDIEINQLMDKIKIKLELFRDQIKPQKKEEKTRQGSQGLGTVIKKKSTTIPSTRQLPPLPFSREKGDEAVRPKTPSPPMLSKLETNKYLLEMTSEGQHNTASEPLRAYFGPNVIHQQANRQQMLIAMGNEKFYPVPAYPSDATCPSYSLLKIDRESPSVQVHKESENMTLYYGTPISAQTKADILLRPSSQPIYYPKSPLSGLPPLPSLNNRAFPRK